MAPESRLTLTVTITVPGFGEIVPDKVTDDPRAMEVWDRDNVMLVGRTKLADTVTGLLGIVNWQGLLDGPPEHDAPEIVQLENK